MGFFFDAIHSKLVWIKRKLFRIPLHPLSNQAKGNVLGRGDKDRENLEMTKRYLMATLLVLSFAFAAGGVAVAQQVSVSHAQGETTVDVDPEVVFSYDFAAIDTLHTLGIEVDGAPPLAGTAPSWLPVDPISIGSLFEPDYEVVNAEQPDLIIVAGRSAPVYPELAAMAPTIDLTFDSTFLVGLERNTRVLGAIFAKEAEAEESGEEEKSED